MFEDAQTERETPQIAKVVKKIKLDEQTSDFAFWQTQSFAARLSALEDIRRAYIAWKYDSDPGFQRVFKLVKRK